MFDAAAELGEKARTAAPAKKTYDPCVAMDEMFRAGCNGARETEYASDFTARVKKLHKPFLADEGMLMQTSVLDDIWSNSTPVWCPPIESQELFGGCDCNVCVDVQFERSEESGLTFLTARRTDELPRSKILPKHWPRFLEATVKEWESILSTGAVTIISPKQAETIRRDYPDRIIPSRHVFREKPGEGLGAASTAKCRWCVIGFRDADLLDLASSNTTNYKLQ